MAGGPAQASAERTGEVRRLTGLVAAAALALAAAPAGASVVEGAASCPASPGSRQGQPSCEFVRPGSRIAGSNGRCTINFIFSDRSNLYAGTAGHCVRKGESIYSFTLQRALGRVVFKLHDSYYRDFALIEIYPELKPHIDPAAGLVPGPTGIAGNSDEGPTEVQHLGYGYGLGYVPATDERQPATYARRGLALSLQDPRELHFVGAVGPGDSGSGAYLNDGSVLGVITVAEVEVSTANGARGTVAGGRLRPLLRAADRALGSQIYLVTSDGALVR